MGEMGEICVKGAAVIKGYLNRPEATAETIVDGWLHTGTLATLMKRILVLVDRAKDMILRGGENIYGAEVESLSSIIRRSSNASHSRRRTSDLARKWVWQSI